MTEDRSASNPPTMDDYERKLLGDAPITLVSPSALPDVVSALQRRAYDVVWIDCSTYERFERSARTALRWKEQFGYVPDTGRISIDALGEALWGVPFDGKRCGVIVLHGFSRLMNAERRAASGTMAYILSRSDAAVADAQRVVALVETERAALNLRDVPKTCVRRYSPDIAT